MVHAEREPDTPGRKRRSRGWLLLAALFITMPVLLALIPVFFPINLQLGPARLWVGTAFRHRTTSPAEPAQGLQTFSLSTNRIHDLEDRPDQTSGRGYGATLRVADWIYYLGCFQGHPVW